MEEWYAKQLDEGYFKSYPESVVMKRIETFLKKNHSLCGHFDLYRSSLSNPTKHDEENNFQLLTLAVEKYGDEAKNKLSSELAAYGWYIGSANREISDSGERYFEISLEPKFPSDDSEIEKKSKELIEKVKIFYHVSFKKYEQKILKNGLLPSLTSRSTFEHPERIYLFTDIDIAKQFVRFHKTSLLSFTKEMNKRKIKGGKIAKDKLAPIDSQKKFQDKEADEEPMVAFEVDLYQMMKDGKTINLYHDNRFNEKGKAYLTQNTIPPKYLKKITV